MKRIILSILSIGFVLNIVAVYTVYAVIFKVPTFKSEVSGNPVENSYNNYTLSGGDLCRVGDALYFNYYKNEFNYGLVELTKRGSKRIYWFGVHLYPELTCIRPYQNRVYNTDYPSSTDQYYDAEKECFVSAEPIPLDYRETDYGLVYIGYIDNDKNKFYLEHNGKKQVLMNAHRICYIAQDAVYAVTKSSKKGYRAIRKCDYETQKVTVVGMIPLRQDEHIERFLIEDDYAVYETDLGFNIYKIKMDNQSEPVKVAEECAMVNAYNGKLYFSQPGKLIAHDLSTGENQILCESKFISLRSDPYILDDTWVYFVSGSSTLWRVSNRGGKPQRIFG